MATTSPDNIRTPDLGDSYNLVPDLQTMANDTQDALIERANAYKGTMAQRTAFTTQAEDGVLWQDTNGDRRIWAKHGPSNTWRELVATLEDTGWISITPPSPGSGSLFPAYRRVGNVVYMRGRVNNIPTTYDLVTLPVGFRPSSFQAFPSTANTAGSNLMVSVNFSGEVVLYRTPGSPENSQVTLTGVVFPVG